MIKSMTGYGKATGENDTVRLTIEIRSLNSKQMDLSTRIPSRYKPIELDIRSMLTKALVRGKVEFALFREELEGESHMKLNTSLIKTYQDQLRSASDILGESVTEYLPLILKMPDVFKTEHVELDPAEGELAIELTQMAIDQLNAYRDTEGAALLNDLNTRGEQILQGLDAIESHEGTRKQQVRDRLSDALGELGSDVSLDQNRFEQELIYYLEKYDINEEKVRLRHHCQYFQEMLDNHTSQGKKLGFIAQEMGREINTIGSKANYADMQRSVVKMKDELEKIKEQLLNVL